jgi:alcohol dehydrogenase class IV
MIDHALPFNIETSADRFRVMAGVVGLKHPSPQAFLDWLRDLKKRVGIPATLAEAGVPRQIDKLSDLAMQDTCHLNNPRPCTRDDFKRIFTAAFSS